MARFFVCILEHLISLHPQYANLREIGIINYFSVVL